MSSSVDRSAYNRKYHMEHRSLLNARSLKRYHLNPAKHQKAHREWYEKNKAHAIRYSKKYRSLNIFRVREIEKLYREANKSKINIKNKLWHSRNRNWDRRYAKEYRSKPSVARRVKLAKKRYNRENPGRVRLWSRAAYRKHRKERLKRARDYRLQNPEKVRRISRIKRARKASARGCHTHEEWMAKVRAFLWKCYYCGKKLNVKTLTQDHAVPLVRGGSNFISNLLPACRLCNSRKNKKTLCEYMRELGRAA